MRELDVSFVTGLHVVLVCDRKFAVISVAKRRLCTLQARPGACSLCYSDLP